MSSIRQYEHKTHETHFQNVDLSVAEKRARECFHTEGPGRPLRNPLGLLRAFIMMRMKEMRSLREFTRTLDTDQRIRRLCLIEDGESGYPRSVLSRFTTLFVVEELERVIEEKVVNILKRNRVEVVDAVLDASFIKAWSTRHPRVSSRGFSNPDARVGRSSRGFNLGYKLHVSVDHERILSLAGVIAPANENEKRHSPALIERTKRVLRRAGARLRSLVADSQYSSGRMRGLVDEAVITYAANERRGEDVLRVDGRFRAHGQEEERARYRKRPAVEAAYSSTSMHSPSTQVKSSSTSSFSFTLSGAFTWPRKPSTSTRKRV